jgi:hypothetical protein
VSWRTSYVAGSIFARNVWPGGSSGAAYGSASGVAGMLTDRDRLESDNLPTIHLACSPPSSSLDNEAALVFAGRALVCGTRRETYGMSP